MESVLLDVLGLTSLLTLAVLMLPVARRLNFPYTIFLALIGIGLGLIVQLGDKIATDGVAGEILTALRGADVTSEIIFFVFLPALIFESSLSIDVRRLLEDVGPILFLAIIGLLISTFVVGGAVHWISGEALVVCLLLGAIVSATDPVAVVAIFKELGAPKRLAILVEGESLFNDATAIVMFNILAAMIIGAAAVDVGGGAFAFAKVFIGGIIVGYVMARIFCAIFARLHNSAMVEITLTVTLAYFSFVIAEHYLHLSGVMAVVTAALVLGGRGRTAISESTWHNLTETWELIGFWANSLIFLLVGMAVPSILADAASSDFIILGVLTLAAFVARGALIAGFIPLLSRVGLAAQVSRKFQAVMIWGGLRGAVSLALALAVVENPAFDPDTRRFIMLMVTGFVLFTLFVQAPTIPWLMRLFGLDKLAPVDLAVRNRAMRRALKTVSTRISEIAEEQNTDPKATEQLLAHYAGRRHELDDETQAHAGLSKDAWMTVGLGALLGQERHIYLQRYSDGVLSSELARHMMRVVDDLKDALKADGLDGYRTAYRLHLGFDRQFRLALLAQRRFDWTQLLSKQLADRFETLRVMRAALIEVRKRADTIADFVGEETAQLLNTVMTERLDAVDSAFDALKAQYPDYATALEERYLEQTGLRLEETSYRELHHNAVISPEVFHNLTDALRQRARVLEERPPLDLGLHPEQLVAKVPIFASQPPERISQIAAMLKPYFAVPGELLVRKGEQGRSMYFVSSGCLEVGLPQGAIQLANGDFFGELSLLHGAPRTADVKAQGFCDLLTLDARDFDSLLDETPGMREEIERIATQRSRDNAAANS